MRRSLSLYALLVCAAAVGAPGAAAQRLQPRIPPATAVRTRSLALALGRDAGAPPARHSVLSTVLYGAGGAVLGAWAGYMTSQIVWSDWQELSHKNGISRLRYTLTGAGIGAIAGALLGRHVTAGAPLPQPGRRRSPWGDLPVISQEEVRASRARTAAELLLQLRPDWVNPRRSDTFGGAVVQTYTSEGVPVYLDGEPIGTVDDLSNISIHEVDSVEYYDVRAANSRWGAAANLRAIINVLTAKGES